MATEVDMTIDDVRARVERIAAMANDDEAAHASEDSLHEDVLRAIAAGVSDPASLAAEALRTLAIPFARWCA